MAKTRGVLDDEAIILGIAQDNPENTQPENCRYDACIVVSEDFIINDDRFNVGTLVDGKYAVFTIEHTMQAIQKAWGEIFPELLKQGYQIDETKPIIERYTAKMVSNHKCEICVPIY
jgi:DNA gyrase inhibitor GyrI